MLTQTVVVQKTKTNTLINIPIKQTKALNIKGGDTLLLTADTEKETITIRKVGSKNG